MLAEPSPPYPSRQAKLHPGEGTSILALAPIVFREHTVRCRDQFLVAGGIVITAGNTSEQLGYDLITFQLWEGFECLQNTFSSVCHKTKFSLWQRPVKCDSRGITWN